MLPSSRSCIISVCDSLWDLFSAVLWDLCLMKGGINTPEPTRGEPPSPVEFIPEWSLRVLTWCDSVSLKTWGFNISKQTDLKRLASVDSSWCHHACWMRKQWLQQCQHAQGGGKRQLGPRMWMCLLVGNYVLRAFCILTRQQGITFFINHGTCTEAPWHYNRNVKQNRRWQQMTKMTYLYFLMKTVLTTYKKQNTKV